MSKERVVILGAGESGIGAALLAMDKGYDVFLSDNGKIANKYLKQLEDNRIPYEQGQHTDSKIFTAQLVIKSPGIPDDVPLIQKLVKSGIEVIGEIEFASRYTHAKMYAITGTNGKTTTTMMLYHLLKSSGISVGLAGNIGYSLARQVIDDSYACYVLELSSFQLDSLAFFKADLAIILNITEDHLNRYDFKFENYIDSKFRVTNNMEPNDHLIYFCDDKVIEQGLAKKQPNVKKWEISLDKNCVNGAFLEDGYLRIRSEDDRVGHFDIAIREVPLKGMHNMVNTMSAVTAAAIIGVDNSAIKRAISTFKNIEHRLETVGTVNDVTFINDSKATNVDAAMYALGAFERPIIWIAGGIDKGNNYQKMKSLVGSNVKAMVCLGINNLPLLKAFNDEVDQIVETNNIKFAVKRSFELASKGDVILLSPACASFDLFKNYEDRGDQFKQEALQLIDKNKEVV